MLAEEEKFYRLAGEIAHKALEYGVKLVKPGVKTLDICEKIERKIIELGGKPAFPVNVSVNSVAAHYTSPPNDETLIPDNSLVKIDVGVHIDGCIADTAVTVVLGKADENLVVAAAEALRAAEDIISPEVSTKEIGAVIEETIKKYGYRPVTNLCGHQIERYKLHAGKIIPNIKTQIGSKIGRNTVYAIEPFSTNGAGYVVETNEAHIFRLSKMKKIRKIKLYRKSIVRDIYSQCRTLPFTLRWFTKLYPNLTLLEEDIKTLICKKIVSKYPVLIEVKRGLVAQAEDTIMIIGKDVVNLTNALDLLM